MTAGVRRVLLLTDSLGLPRSQPEVVEYDEAWPQMLRAAGYEIHQISIGGATSADLIDQSYYGAMFRPDAVVVQAGIVDCAPRYLKPWELHLLRSWGTLGKRISARLNRPWIIRSRAIANVDPDRFERITAGLERRFDVPVFFVGILPPSPVYEQILPGITRRIAQYDAILRERARFVPMSDLDPAMLMSDHHHLNARGHRELSRRVERRLKDLEVAAMQDVELTVTEHAR